MCPQGSGERGSNDDMGVAIPIAAGLLCGVASGLPYAAAFRIQKRDRDASVLPALVAVCVSFIEIILFVLLGFVLLREVLAVFGCAYVISFLATVSVVVAVFGRRHRP